MPRGVLTPSGISRGMNVPYSLLEEFMPSLLPSSARGTNAEGASCAVTALAVGPTRRPILDSAQSVCTATQSVHHAFKSHNHALNMSAGRCLVRKKERDEVGCKYSSPARRCTSRRLLSALRHSRIGLKQGAMAAA
jgi:hypothetical protein